ncbi:glycoside hydrolase family 127 protein [Herbiconiux sp. CPCC 203407]|uniref:Glycoside hydrolase family 127 protein n=1 Tax=Herbiconiux oxytropis TaxID=2970915 RepID=A0AA42BWR8_9MICO|nr:glycoside hydrolase family 127 protein [Herbiconiux oxytropis]MCS5723651.1 glycoside hydrolase family 127 protein [Herbiconiux oxytropis]MCS5726968.1 glycoside hydrolase family 127 protein [Herbiconiux oxytropis]
MTGDKGVALTRRRLLGGGAALGGIAVATRVLNPGQAAPASAQPAGAAASAVAAGPRSAFHRAGATHPARTVRAAAKEVYPESWSLNPFPLSAVTLGQSVFTRAQQQALILNRAYSVDALLAVYRRNAGIDTKGARPPGGWEEYGPNPDAQRWGPAEYTRGQNTAGAGGLLRGHYGGHFLSGLSMAYASTGEAALADKVNAFVAGLEECRAALAAQTHNGAPRYSHPGFLSAYGEWQFSALEAFAPYGEIWAPYYTLHKIVAGLLDAHAYVGNEQALKLAEGIGHWVHSRLAKTTAEQRQKMWASYIAGECGGMNDVLVQLYWRSNDAKKQEFLDAANLFTYDAFVDACAAGEDTLNGRHANQYIPTFVGYIKLYNQTGEQRLIDGVRNMFDMVVPGRTYAHGGTGEGELWGPAGAVAGDIGPRNAESCAAYNMLKVARYLFMNEQDTKYMDYYERTVLNHILGGRRNRESTTGPENCYMFPVNPGTRKEYGNGNIGTCCGGTALESHVKYQDTIYLRAKDASALFVNLYIASTLTWEEMGLVLTQASSYPESDTSTLTIDQAPQGALTINVRVPAWVTGGAEIAINGVPTGTANTPGSYVPLTHDWKKGDTITVRVPLALRTEPTPDRADIQALVYGPTVLTAVDPSTKYLKVSLFARQGLDGSISRGVTQEPNNVFVIDGRVFEPAYNGKDVQYHMYFERSEPTVVFAGRSAGVANPKRTQGGSLLDEVWAKAPFADRNAFIEAVRSVSQSFVDSGLLSARDRQKVLLAAGRAPIDS